MQREKTRATLTRPLKPGFKHARNYTLMLDENIIAKSLTDKWDTDNLAV